MFNLRVPESMANLPGRTVTHGERPPAGENHYRSRLSESKVAEIRRRIAAKEPLKVIAIDLGVSSNAVSDVNRGRTWRGA